MMSSTRSVIFQEVYGENQLSEVFCCCYNDLLLNHLVWGKVSLPTAGGWNDTSFEVLSNPNHSIVALYKVFQRVRRQRLHRGCV